MLSRSSDVWMSLRGKYRKHTIFDGYSVDSILPLISSTFPGIIKLERYNGNHIMVRRYTRSLQVFKRSQQCTWCGLTGNMFVVMQFNAYSNDYMHAKHRPTLQLFHVNGAEITMMTLDHTIPRWCGGPNAQANIQTMCKACNAKKGMTTDMIGHPIVRKPTEEEKLAAYQWHDALRNASYEEREEAFKRHMMTQGFKVGGD